MAKETTKTNPTPNEVPPAVSSAELRKKMKEKGKK